jgi:hypothetical protein
MSKTYAVSTLIERARVLCGLPAFTTDTTVTTAAALDFAQAACEMLGGIVGERSEENYLAAFDTLTTQAGVEIVSLPDACNDLLRLSWLRSASEEITLERAVIDEFVAYPHQWSGNIRPRYRIIDNAIDLFPTPDAVYTLRIYYTTGIYVTSTASTIVCRPFWDQWITMQLCKFFRPVQQKGSPDFDGMQAQAEMRIERQLRRDRAGIRQIRDLRGEESRDTMRRLLPPRG